MASRPIHARHPGDRLQAVGQRPRWFTRPATIALSVIPFVILGLAPQDAWSAGLLAYANALIIGVAAIRFLKQGTLQGLIPVLFLLWLGVGWVLGTIYFAAFLPEMTYKTVNDERLMLHGNAGLQLKVFVFLLIYLGTFSTFASRRMKLSEYRAAPREATRFALAAMALFVPGLLLNAVNKAVGLPGPLEYVANGANLYLAALPLTVGAMFAHIGFPLKVITLVFLAAIAGFNVLGNARGDAAMPLAMFTLGYLLLSGVSQQRKFMSMIVGTVAFLAIVVIGDTTRTVLKGIGFGDLSARVEALSQWQEVAARTSPFAKTFGRLFWTAGHTILTLVPDSYTYVDFSVGPFIKEFFLRQLPGKLVATPAYYSSPERLRAYDFNITDVTSVELSFLGSLWMLGGWPPLLAGSVAVAVLHVLLSHLIAAMARRSGYMAIFFFSMVAMALVWAQNLDIISQTRWLNWRLAIAAVLYVLMVGPLVRAPRQSAAAPPLPRAWRPA